MRVLAIVLIVGLTLGIQARSPKGLRSASALRSSKVQARQADGAIKLHQQLPGQASSAGDCPAGWVYFQSTNRCFTQINNSLPFDQAKSYCTNMGASLASIQNAFENSFIANTFSGNNDQEIGTFAYIGLYSPADNGTWVWTDGTPMSYTNWISGTPPSDDQQCGLINTQVSTGKWYTIPCSFGNYFICAVNPGTPIHTPSPPPPPPPGACQTGWTYYASSTGSKRCYMQVNSITTPFNSAIGYCRNLGGDLVSIHSADEDNFISSTFSGNTGDDEGMPFAMIGLYSPNNDTNWQWSDSTPLDYQNWIQAGQSGYPNAAIATQTPTGQWYYDNSDSPNYFICAMKSKV